MHRNEDGGFALEIRPKRQFNRGDYADITGVSQVTQKLRVLQKSQVSQKLWILQE